MQDTWLSNRDNEIQSYVGRHDVKRFYDSLQCVYKSPTTGSSPMHGADNSRLITDKHKNFERWAQYFNSVFIRSSSINDETIQRFFQVAINPDLNILPSEDEVAKAIRQMSTGKASGPDAIPAEVFSLLSGSPIINKLTELF